MSMITYKAGLLLFVCIIISFINNVNTDRNIYDNNRIFIYGLKPNINNETGNERIVKNDPIVNERNTIVKERLNKHILLYYIVIIILLYLFNYGLKDYFIKKYPRWYYTIGFDIYSKTIDNINKQYDTTAIDKNTFSVRNYMIVTLETKNRKIYINKIETKGLITNHLIINEIKHDKNIIIYKQKISIFNAIKYILYLTIFIPVLLLFFVVLLLMMNSYLAILLELGLMLLFLWMFVLLIIHERKHAKITFENYLFKMNKSQG